MVSGTCLYRAGGLAVRCHGYTMYLHMVPHTRFARKLFTACLAFERFLSSVDSEMVVKMTPVVELPATRVAFEWPFP